MDSYSEMYINNLVESILQRIYYDDFNVNFFKHYNTFSIPLENVNKTVIKSGYIVQILFHEYKQGQMQSAYQPLIDWIIALYDRYYSAEVSFEQFLDDAGVYSLHRSIYISYRENGVCHREEDLIPVEYKYEREKFITGLIGIFNYVTQKIPLFIVLNKLHYAERSLLYFIYRLLSSNPNNRIAILAGYNEVYPQPDYTKATWNSLLGILEARNLLQDWSLEDKALESNDGKEFFSPVSSQIKEYITLLNNMNEMSALEQAIYYCQIINEAINRDNLTISDEDKLDFYFAYAMASFYSGRYAFTFGICDEIKKCLEKSSNITAQITYNSIISLCHSCLGQDKLSEKAAESAIALSKSIDNDFVQFRAKMIACMVRFRCWINVYLWGVEYNAEEDFLDQAEKYHYYNHLAYIHLFCFANDKTYYDKDPAFCESQPHFKKGMEYADLLNNDAVRLRAWKKNVVFSSGFGYYPAVDHFYQKSLEILEKLDDKIEKGNVYNGLGYNRIVSEEFSVAAEYFNNALEIWNNLGMPENMGESLYNMAVNAILARDYKTACDLLITAIRIMKNLGQLKLDLCNMSKIYGMIVLCYYKLGIEYNAQLYLNKMQLIVYHLLFPEGEPSYFMWDDDMFFYHFCKGLLTKKDNLVEAQQCFDKAWFHLKRTEGLWFLVYELFALEQAELYHAQGRHMDAVEGIEACIKYCEENNYNHKLKRLNCALRGIPYEDPDYHIGLTKITSSQALALSRRVGAELQLTLKNKSLRFLASWQEMMNRDDISVKELIKNAMYIIQNNYKADKIIYFEMEKSQPKLVYCDDDMVINDEMLKDIASYFIKRPSEFMVNRMEKSFYDYKDIISLFGINNIVSAIGIPVIVNGKLQSVMIALIEMHDNMCDKFSVFLDGDLTIFSVAFHQLIDSIARLSTQESIKKMNVKLEQTSVTDMLTGLYNRQGFAKTINSEMAKFGSDIKHDATVLYIDLDNFKYYNDTFGHAIGDIILVSFANIFKEITHNRGYAIRYGGDEFVIIVTDADENEGAKIAKSIYQRLDDTDGFADKLKEKMGPDFKIAPEKRVSCSIGIATTHELTVDGINEAMKHADDALYVVKKTTKRDYKIWTPNGVTSR